MFSPGRDPLLKFKLKEVLNMRDIYSLIIFGLFTLLAVFLYPLVHNASTLILLNITLMITILSIAYLSSRGQGGRLFFLFHRLYIIPIVYIAYKQVQSYIKVINPGDYDNLLINLDKALFGVNPTQWMSQISNPFLTEYLQIVYMLFFFLPILLGLELHLKMRHRNFDYFARQIVFGFFLSYLLYFIFPAVGPRFTLHDFFSINTELPGLFLTNQFRDFINSGGSIPMGSLNPVYYVNRDCMPSGHTMITLINTILAFKLKSSYRWIFLVLGVSLIFSTVYLRYHYVVDVMAGIAFAFISMWLEPKIRKYFAYKDFMRV